MYVSHFIKPRSPSAGEIERDEFRLVWRVLITRIRILQFLELVLWDCLIGSYWASGARADMVLCFSPGLMELGST